MSTGVNSADNWTEFSEVSVALLAGIEAINNIIYNVFKIAVRKKCGRKRNNSLWTVELQRSFMKRFGGYVRRTEEDPMPSKHYIEFYRIRVYMC